MSATEPTQIVRVTTRGLLDALGGTNKHSIRRRLLGALQQAPGPLRINELVDCIYGDDPDGGPDDAGNSIRKTIHHLRRAGHNIRSACGNGGLGEREACYGSGYWLT